MDLRGGYVLLPQPIEEEALKLLAEQGLEVVQAADLKEKTVAQLMKGARAIILRTGITITENLLGQAEDLWTISRTGGGVDNVDLSASTLRGIVVTSSLGVNTDSVVEHCCALILALFKQLFLLDRETRAGNFRIRYGNIPSDLQNKSLGILGFGRIGSRLARVCSSAFGMKVLAFDRYLSEDQKGKYSPLVSFVSIEELFSRSDVVSVHLPLNDETRGMVDRKYLSLMKPHAFIINTSRGGVIVEKDLVCALQESTIMGAGLDVLEEEPIKDDNPILKLKNVILTPHTAALTKECVVRMATSAVWRTLDLFSGFIPENIANPDVLEHPKWRSLKKRREE
jgi:D-3-phosphoglycerate dehydrogenase